MKMLLSGGLCVWLLALTTAAPSPKRQGIDVEKTVAQVEQVLRQNSNLPRLSRDDILQLLNDIRAEDERSTSASAERSTPSSVSIESVIESEEKDREQIELNEISDKVEPPHSDLRPDSSSPPQVTRRPSSRPEDLMVVLPYTPRDGYSLQELFTRPPRVALLRAPSPMRAANSQSNETKEEIKEDQTALQNVKSLNKSNTVQSIVVSEEPRDAPTTAMPTSRVNESASNDINIESEKDNKKASAEPIQIPAEYPDIAADLREFLQVHGLDGNPGSFDEHFLLPLDGFKPLPPLREVDGSVELPEKILLTYDLVSPAAEDLFTGPGRPEFDSIDLPADTVEYQPLQPDLPFEVLDTLSSEIKKTVVPLDAPSRKRKAAEVQTSSDAPKFSPIEYDSIKVIPLNNGPDPLESIELEEDIDLQKRQSENSTTTEAPATEASQEETTTVGSSEKADISTTTAAPSGGDSVKADSDSGPSIADLESSFGAPAPADESEAQLPPPRKNGFYWMLDWNSFLEVGDGDEKVNIRFEPKLGDPQMFLPVTVP